MKRQSIMNLWQQCFHDSEEFIQFYFKRKYQDKNAMLYTENGEPLSAFLMLPYPFIWKGKTLMAAYISGACTDAKARNRGLMTHLLQEGFRQMHNDNIALSVLIPAEPWLYGYYAKLGYTTIFYKSTNLWQAISDITPNCKIEIIDKARQPVIQESYTYFLKKMQAKPCYIGHSFEDYQIILGDLYLSDGKLILARSQQAPYSLCGMALTTIEKGEMTAKELLYDTPEICNHLLATATNHWKVARAVYRTPYHIQTAQPYGMARIIHLETLLQHYAAIHPHIEETFCIADNILPSNQGTFHISHGECRKTDNTLSPSAIDIAVLPEKLFANLSEPPYMNLMID